jgi:hypothetical protein
VLLAFDEGRVKNVHFGSLGSIHRMQTVTIPQILDRLQQLSGDKLAVVYDFVSYLSERDVSNIMREIATLSRECLFASEDVLRRDWERPEEEAAWANL